jgi:PAS domain S-box-containing protein
MMTGKLKILHLEDMPTDAELIGRELRRSNLSFEKKLVDDEAEYTAALTEYKPDIILSDHSLPLFNSLEALRILKQSGLNIPFILVTATISEEFAVNIMKEGASDYILKDRMQRLPNAILNALEKYRLDAEQQRANQELYLLFNTIDEVFFSIDIVNSKLIQISPGCQKVYGYMPAEFLNNPDLWNLVIHPEDKHIQLHNFEKLNRGETVVSQYRIIHQNKEIRWLESKIIPSLSSTGLLLRLYGVSRDVTERKQAEELIAFNHIQLKEASETQANILDALPPNIALLNETGKIIAVNESWKKLALYNNLGMPNYGVGYRYLTIAKKATGAEYLDLEKIETGINDVMRGDKKEFTMEYAAHSLTEKKWFQLVVAPLANNTYNGSVILHIDITDRKLAEVSLIQSETNLRSVFENTDLAIVLFDNSLKIVSFNQNAQEFAINNYHRKLKIGNSASKYFPKEKKLIIDQINKCAIDQEIVTYETFFDLADGTKEWYDIRWVGVTNKKKEHAGIIMTLENITEKKIAEMERDKMTADLTQRNKDLEQFTYIVSHNLRAPVANILGLSDILLESENVGKEIQDALKALSLSANSLDRVILDLNHILQVSSQVNAKIERVSLSSLLEEISAGISHMIHKDKVDLTYDFSEIDELLILKSYLYSVLQNLVINSIKYQRADAAPRIQISSKLNGDKIIIYVKDNGKGIDLPRYGAQLFGLYKRFDYSVEGKGMGLFMVKMQVESLGGTINVQSSLNTGTEFSLEFPIQDSN